MKIPICVPLLSEQFLGYIFMSCFVLPPPIHRWLANRQESLLQSSHKWKCYSMNCNKGFQTQAFLYAMASDFVKKKEDECGFLKQLFGRGRWRREICFVVIRPDRRLVSFCRPFRKTSKKLSLFLQELLFEISGTFYICKENIFQIITIVSVKS